MVQPAQENGESGGCFQQQKCFAQMNITLD